MIMKNSIQKAKIAGKQQKGELIFMNLLLCRVCYEGSWDEALEWVRKNNPAGTSNDWSKAERKNQRPVRCADNPKRWHYMFQC